MRPRYQSAWHAGVIARLEEPGDAGSKTLRVLEDPQGLDRGTRAPTVANSALRHTRAERLYGALARGHNWPLPRRRSLTHPGSVVTVPSVLATQYSELVSLSVPRR